MCVCACVCVEDTYVILVDLEFQCVCIDVNIGQVPQWKPEKMKDKVRTLLQLK